MSEIRFPPQPQMISPGCTGYFHIPPVWMVDQPSADEIEQGGAALLSKEVFRTTLTNNIRVRVRRDGVIIFDCRGWAEAGETTIPAYQPVRNQPIPKAVAQAEVDAEARALIRAQLINAHQACLNASHYLVHGQGLPLGAMVIPTQAFQLYDFEHPVGITNEHDPLQHFVSEMISYDDPAVRRLPVFRNRRLVESDTLVASFGLLETLLKHRVKDIIVITDLLFRAGSQFTQSRFAESLVLSWAACERLLNELWQRYLDARKLTEKGESRVDADRKKKLTGRDFSASVISETLELAGEISFELFELISAARKSRNNWLHGLKPVDDRDAVQAMRAGQGLFQRAAGINLHLSMTRQGGTGGAAPIELVKKWRQESERRAKLNTGRRGSPARGSNA